MIYCVKAYKENGIWFFDDDSHGIKEEPFICGSSDITDFILKEKGIFNGSHRGVKMYFSDQKESEDMVELKKIEDLPDKWARYVYQGMEGLLCPLALKYFGCHPQEIFIKFTKIPFFIDFQIVDSDFLKP